MTRVVFRPAAEDDLTAIAAPVAYASWLGEYSGAIPRTIEHRVENMRALFHLLVSARPRDQRIDDS